MKYIATNDSSLLRDVKSRALISENETERLAHRRKNKEKSRIDSMEAEMKEIKNLLTQLLQDRN